MRRKVFGMVQRHKSILSAFDFDSSVSLTEIKERVKKLIKKELILNYFTMYTCTHSHTKRRVFGNSL